MSGLMLAGDVYIDRLTDDGQSTGYLDPVNTTKLAITQPDPDVKTRVSNKKDTLGQALDSVSLPKPSELSISIDDQPADILAMALLGSIETYTQGSGTATSEAVTLLADRWVNLAHRNINDAGFSVAVDADAWATATVYASGDMVKPTTGSNLHYYICTVGGTSHASTEPTWPTNGSTVTDGTVTWQDAGALDLVEDTDYQVNRAAGMIKGLSSGGVAVSLAVVAGYGYAAVTGSRITGGTRPICKARILVDGKNLANGKLCKLEIDEATLSPTGEVDLLNGEFVTTELKGTMRTLTGKTNPYRYEEYD